MQLASASTVVVPRGTDRRASSPGRQLGVFDMHMRIDEGRRDESPRASITCGCLEMADRRHRRDMAAG